MWTIFLRHVDIKDKLSYNEINVEWALFHGSFTNNIHPDTIFINEFGLYSLILSSNEINSSDRIVFLR